MPGAPRSRRASDSRARAVPGRTPRAAAVRLQVPDLTRPGADPAGAPAAPCPRPGPALPAGGTLSVGLSDLAFEPIEAIANRPRLVELARQICRRRRHRPRAVPLSAPGLWPAAVRPQPRPAAAPAWRRGRRRGAFGVGCITHLSRAVAHAARDLLARDFPGGRSRLTSTFPAPALASPPICSANRCRSSTRSASLSFSPASRRHASRLPASAPFDEA